MNSDNLEYIDQTGIGGKSDEGPQTPLGSDTSSKRTEPRTELTTQAFVSIPPLNSRAFQILEVSRSGMFLAFIDAATTLFEMERGAVEKGANVEVAFAVPVGGQRHRVSVRARIARITRQGLGVEFYTRNPPQLAALREIFSSAVNKAPVSSQRREPNLIKEKSRVIEKPSDSSGWQAWELLD